jgi:uncharacterized membrane protein YoaK (UPF0700 family)
VPAIAVLLAACAGATDVLAFFGLGGAFAGIITGNLVTVGYGIAAGRTALVRPAVTAVAGVIAGEAAAAALLRRPRAANWLLAAEFALLLLVLAGWLATGAHPGAVLTLILLALLSVSVGRRSIWALRIHQTTTYFTGMLTRTIDETVGGSKGGVRRSTRQLIASGAVLHAARPAAPAVPLFLLAMAAAVHLRGSRQADPGASQRPA